METEKVSQEIGYVHPGKIHVVKDDDGFVLNPRGPIRNTTGLQRSIKAVGRVLNPLLVRKDDDARLWLIDGHRRLTAARALKLKHVPYYLSDAKDDSEILDIMMASNVQESFPAIVLGKDGVVIGGIAKAVATKINYGGRSLQSLGDLMGLQPDVVSAHARLNVAPIEVRKAVAKGRMSITAFARMKYAPPDVQCEIVGDDDEEKVSVSKVRDKLKDIKESARSELDFGESADGVLEVLQDILSQLRLALTQDIGPREQFVLEKIRLEAKSYE